MGEMFPLWGEQKTEKFPCWGEQVLLLLTKRVMFGGVNPRFLEAETRTTKERYDHGKTTRAVAGHR
jgi:hypothetical protein